MKLSKHLMQSSSVQSTLSQISCSLDAWILASERSLRLALRLQRRCNNEITRFLKHWIVLFHHLILIYQFIDLFAQRQKIIAREYWIYHCDAKRMRIFFWLCSDFLTQSRLPFDHNERIVYPNERS